MLIKRGRPRVVAKLGGAFLFFTFRLCRAYVTWLFNFAKLYVGFVNELGTHGMVWPSVCEMSRCFVAAVFDGHSFHLGCNTYKSADA